MSLELATPCHGGTCERIPESILIGWVLGTEFATTSSRRRERNPPNRQKDQRLEAKASEICVCRQISDRISGDEHPRPACRPGARPHNDLHIAAEQHEEPHEA